MHLNMYFKWLSVGIKMFILYFVSMAIAVMVMGYLSYQKATDIIQSQIGEVALQTIQQANKRLEIILQEYEDRSYIIFGSKELQKGILGQFEDNYDRTTNTLQITNFISNLVNSKNDTVNLFILGQRAVSFRYSGNNTPTISVLPSFEPSKEDQDWYQKIIEADGRVVWFGIRDSFIKQKFILDEEKPVLIFGRALKDIWGTSEIIGVMVYEVDPSVVEDLLTDIDFNASGSSIIVDRDNRVVGDADDRSTMRLTDIDLPRGPSGIMNTVLDGKEMIVVYDLLSINDWKLVGLIPAVHFVKDSREIGFYTLYLTIGLMLVAVILALIVSRRVHTPVHTMIRSMRKAREGDFDVQITAQRRDEFGILFENFNLMVSRIKTLIDELYIQRLIKNEMQLKMLVSQINAHFIYNTLDSIHWIARIRKVDEISTMISGLSNYLRISLSSGKDTITVQEAVELVESYLSIQKVRYQDKFEVDMRMDPELVNYKVLKFVFQPLVENAIYHGLEKKNGKGRLLICWLKTDETLHYEVQDDGVGIPADKLREITDSLANNDVQGENYFALKNINAQIKLSYGQEYGLKLESGAGVGTKVSLRLPLR